MTDRINDEPQPERRQAINEPAPSGSGNGGTSNGWGCLPILLLPLVAIVRQYRQEPRRLKTVRPA